MPVPAGGPALPIPDDPPYWTPARHRVADYVPHRTLVRKPSATTDSADQYAMTFGPATRPNGDTVDRLIADGVSYVLSRVPDVDLSLQGMAALVATLYAAVAVERSWPHDDQSLQRATDMERRMDTLLAELVAASDKLGGTQEQPLMPIGCFPPPVPWGDSYL
ncbi:hypothetical protein [Verrucosispora sp. TAA-831]|uniref:hypothetical protein n=1 Tax=Verrucosispora sp. TAA-831 TaxID=3422227 RepID=UPI003D700529